MGRGTQQEPGCGQALLYGAPTRRISPVDRVRDLAGRKPELAWDYLVGLIAARRISAEDEYEALRAIAAADIDALYERVETDDDASAVSPQAIEQERDYLDASWMDLLRTSAHSGEGKPTDPELLIFQRPDVGPAGFGPAARLFRPRPTDEWLRRLDGQARSNVAACLSGDLEDNALGSYLRSTLVNYVLEAGDLPRVAGRSVQGRLALASVWFGLGKTYELDGRQMLKLRTAVAQDLSVSIAAGCDVWTKARADAAEGNGGRVLAALMFDEAMFGVVGFNMFRRLLTDENRTSFAKACLLADQESFKETVARIRNEARTAERHLPRLRFSQEQSGKAS